MINTLLFSSMMMLFSTSILSLTAKGEIAGTSGCAKDSDCVWVTTDCCNTSHTVVSKQQEKKWNEEMSASCSKQERSGLCPQVVDSKLSQYLPGCVDRSCKENVLQDYSAQNKEFCKNLPRPEERSLCFWEVAIAKLDSELCALVDEKLPFVQRQGKGASACLDRIKKNRIEKGLVDLNFCSGLGDESSYVQCTQRLAEQTHDAGLCYQLRSEGSRYNCAIFIVTASRGSEQCRPFLEKSDRESNFMKSACVSRVAILRKQPEACEKIYEITPGDEKQKYWSWFNCISSVADQNKDPNLCGTLRKRVQQAYAYHDEKTCREEASKK